MQENKPILVVGLGNPGVRYARTRHNVGFMAADYIAGDGATWRAAHDAVIANVLIGGRKVIIAKPQTFMNDSGRAVSSLMTYYKIPLENITVIHDDLDLPVGRIRVKTGGGAAGHNGIRSIDAHIGNEYRRIRIGIGHPRDLDIPMDVVDWVLGRFNDTDYNAITAAIETVPEML